MSRVGELRLVVLPEARGQGVAKALADRAVVVTALGFEREATLRDHVVDGEGRPGNLCVLSRFLDE
jgi:GNAT superfamily N-acetyltransferase